MCGIALIICNDAEKLKEYALQIANRLRHRGPNNYAIIVNKNSAIVHTQLTIRDASKTTQPLISVEGALSYNGELYNTADYNHILQANNSINDVHIVQSYISELLQKGSKYSQIELEGMFAIIYATANKVFAIRDQFGQKPLYQYQSEDKAISILCSEVLPIASCRLNLSINRNQLAHLLHHHYVSPQDSIFNNIHPLPINRQTDLSQKGHYPIILKKYEHTKLKDALTEAIVDIYPSNQIPALALSGGIDSSLIAVMLKDLKLEYNAYSIQSENLNLNGLDTTIINYPNDNGEWIMQAIAAMDEPMIDTAWLNTWLLAKHIAKNNRIVLTGDGADEIFAGYEVYKNYLNTDVGHYLKFRFRTQLPDYTKRRKSKKQGSVNIEKHLQYNTLFSHSDLNVLGLPIDFNANLDLRKYYNSLKSVLKLEQNYSLPGNMLAKVDRAYMQHSLEVRLPYLHGAVVQYSNSLSINDLINNEKTKKPLRKLLIDLGYESITKVPKVGFGLSPNIFIKKPTIDNYFQALYHNREHIVFKFINFNSFISNFPYMKLDERPYHYWGIFCLAYWLDTHQDYIQL
ncbi:MAG: asparagine synthase-related protein [Bacteroidota bacterium]|nr:asparagine synthase-related protein [Bacteroidota bacterium]